MHTRDAFQTKVILLCALAPENLAVCAGAFPLESFVAPFIALITTCSTRGAAWTSRTATFTAVCGCPPSLTRRNSIAGSSHRNQNSQRRTIPYEPTNPRHLRLQNGHR